MSQTSIYVGCSLTHAPEAFRAEVETFKDTLREKYEVMNFLGLEAGTARDVYAQDIGKCITECTLFVAVCDYPSLGLGYEMATAIEKHDKKVLAVAHKDTHISRLVRGIDHPNFSFRRYEKLVEDVPSMVDTKLLVTSGIRRALLA